MRLFTTRLFFFIAMVALAVSCRKGDLPEAQYFGKINVVIADLPGTPKVILYFNDQKLDTVLASGGNGENGKFILPAGKQGKLSVHDAIGDEVLGDTLITILPNAAQNFRFAYSPDLGLKGFIGVSGTSVPADSVFLQLANNLSAAFYPKASYDLTFIYVDPSSGELLESDVVLKNWERGKLNPQVLKFRVQDDLGQGITYAAKLVDPETGEVVLQPDGSEFFIFGVDQSAAGKYTVTGISDDNNGYITNINAVEL